MTRDTQLHTYMQQELRAVQLQEFKILCAIRDVCEHNNIDYWLDGGTLLGAVRHKGFIPWDDDIDIAMFKKDFPRFLEAAKKELPDEFFVQTPETDPSCRFEINKVRLNNSIIVEDGDDFSRPYHKGLYVDIFLQIPYPSLSFKRIKKIVKEYCRCNNILRQQHVYSWKSVAELFWFGGKRLWLRSIWSLANLFCSKDKITGNVISTNGFGVSFKKEDVAPTSFVEFEGETFRAPANPDQYLRNIYGDYMKLPPEDKRKGHAAFFASRLIK